MKIVDYNPSEGQSFQGDVSIIPIPAGIKISTTDEIRPIDNKLILQEGELTGHNHHIALTRNYRPNTQIAADPVLNVRDAVCRRAFGGKSKEALPSARLYRDLTVAQAMQAQGILSRSDLAVGCLVIEGGPMVVTHQEHDGIRLPIGNYLIGRQVESADAEERIIAD